MKHLRGLDSTERFVVASSFISLAFAYITLLI
ncbi:hypothetical protein A33I_07690 [Alkalihalophilus marmarensis DSM 21297]|uniref:Uncharacterized protein n=1 Tax=Alkalihalophilus marmarensis DSM 21297 TaxID=1188261 RepID=U6STS8_9BACI|nr:hypothetical protein A33I_07690 [Alkalihalophilus marmarensis DSM 21297]